MPDNSQLKKQIQEELLEYVAKHRMEIREFQETAANEMFLSTTVRGGLIAAAAESACVDRARQASSRADELKRKLEWHEEMLKKYC